MPSPKLQRRHWLALTAITALAGPQALQARPPVLGEVVHWPSVRLLDGRVLSADQLQGHAAVVVFFATHCPFCQRHNAHVQKLVQASRGLPLQVIGVAQDSHADTVARYLRDHRYSFATTLDASAMHAALSHRDVIPFTCVVDRQGRLREAIAGEMFEEDVLKLAQWARPIEPTHHPT